MLEFKVGGTYICTTAHYTNYKIFYNNTIFDRLTWGYKATKKTEKYIQIEEIKHPQNKNSNNNRRPTLRFTQ